MPHMVHFSAGICLSDCGVLKGFLEEFLRRAEIRTLLKWGQHSTRREYLVSHLVFCRPPPTLRNDCPVVPLPQIV